MEQWNGYHLISYNIYLSFDKTLLVRFQVFQVLKSKSEFSKEGEQPGNLENHKRARKPPVNNQGTTSERVINWRTKTQKTADWSMDVREKFEIAKVVV